VLYYLGKTKYVSTFAQLKLYLPYLLCVFALLFAGISCSKEEPYPGIPEEEAVYLYGASYYGDIYGNGTSDFFVAFESGDYAEVADDRDGDGVEEYYITNGYLLYVDVIAAGSTKLPPDGKYPFSFGCEGGTFGGVEYYTVEGDSNDYERTMTYRTDRDYYYNACGGTVVISNGGRRWSLEIRFENGETRRYSFQGAITYSDESEATVE
jgi:hypothetical protein